MLIYTVEFRERVSASQPLLLVSSDFNKPTLEISGTF